LAHASETAQEPSNHLAEQAFGRAIIWPYASKTAQERSNHLAEQHPSGASIWRSNHLAEQALGKATAWLHKLRASAPTWQSYGVAVGLELVKATLQQATRLSSDLAQLRRGCAPRVRKSYMTQTTHLSSQLVMLGYTNCAPQLRLGQATAWPHINCAPRPHRVSRSYMTQATRLGSDMAKLGYTNSAPRPLQLRHGGASVPTW